jgi:ankyrin repeat protein
MIIKAGHRAHPTIGIIAFTSLALAALVGCAAEQSPGTDASPTSSIPAASLSLEQRMIDAIEAGDVEAVRAVLDAGLSPDAPMGGPAADPQTSLHRAAVADQPAIVTALIEAGATVDVASGGLTPLMLAASYAGPETIQALLDGGADPYVPNPRNYRMLAIHYSARDGNLAALTTFLEQGMDIEIVDDWHFTPLIHACIGADEEVVRFLIAEGANINARDRDGSTPLTWATIYQNEEIIEIITSAGGTV